MPYDTANSTSEPSPVESPPADGQSTPVPPPSAEPPKETSTPLPVETVEKPTPQESTPSSSPALSVEPPPKPTPPPTSTPPVIESTAVAVSALLQKARGKIQLRKRKKLEKILDLARNRGKIANNDVEKLLRVSDATATRLLTQLVRDGRLKRVGPPSHATYEPTG